MLNVLPCLFLENIGEQFCGPAVVGKWRSRFMGHWPVNYELYPIIGGFHLAGGIVGIVVARAFIPIQSGGHGQQVADGQPPLAIIYIRNFCRIEIFEHGRV